MAKVGSVCLFASAIVLMFGPMANAQPSDTTRAQFTVDRMLDIAIAWEAYASDKNSYLPEVMTDVTNSRGKGRGEVIRWSNYSEVSYQALKAALVPTYMRYLPPQDGWDHSFQFAVHVQAGQGIDYVIRSTGSDGLPDEGGTYRPSSSPNFVADIIFAEGEFKVYPRAIERANSSILPASQPMGRQPEKK